MHGQPAATQLNLFAAHTGHTLSRRLEEGLGRPVSLVLTDNSTSMLSARAQKGMLRVRLHRMFLAAEGPVLDEIVSFLKHRNGRMPCFRQFVRANREHLRTKAPNRVAERTAGKYYDLRALYSEINKEYFGGAINAAITWGARRPRLAARKRTLGSFSEHSNTIRISPALDTKSVPRYYVAFIVYHEMLHAAIGISRRGNRRSIHPPEFRNRERLFKDYEKAEAWERGRTS